MVFSFKNSVKLSGFSFLLLLLFVSVDTFAEDVGCISEKIEASSAWEKREDDTYVLLDVRTRTEVLMHPYTHFKNVQNIPLSELSYRLSELDKTKTILVGCRSGNRSLKACDYLKKRGYNTLNLSGGINAWMALQKNTL